jgi:hypothetical protein
VKSQNDVPNGTVLMLGIRFEREEDLDATRGVRQPKVFTYAMLKAGGLWYVTGAGRVPMAAGWGAVERWLAKDGKVVEWVKMATEWADVIPNRTAVEGTGP